MEVSLLPRWVLVLVYIPHLALLLASLSTQPSPVGPISIHLSQPDLYVPQFPHL